MHGLVRESEVFIEDYAEIASGVGGFDQAVVSCESNDKKFGF